MSAQIYAPRMRLPHTPCRQDCSGRSADCHARCCTWQLYTSLRDYAYEINHQARCSLEPDKGAANQMRRAANKNRRGGTYAAK